MVWFYYLWRIRWWSWLDCGKTDLICFSRQRDIIHEKRKTKESEFKKIIKSYVTIYMQNLSEVRNLAKGRRRWVICKFWACSCSSSTCHKASRSTPLSSPNMQRSGLTYTHSAFWTRNRNKERNPYLGPKCTWEDTAEGCEFPSSPKTND